MDRFWDSWWGMHFFKLVFSPALWCRFCSLFFRHFFFCYVWAHPCVFLSGDTLYYRFMSDMSNTEWGYKFTVTGGHRGRFQTGTSGQRRRPRQTLSKVSLGQKLFSWTIMSSFPSRLWDTKADVGRWTPTLPLATVWHLGVAGGRRLSPDREPAPQSHSLAAPPPAVPVPDVRAQHCSCLLFFWPLHPYLLLYGLYCHVKTPSKWPPIVNTASSQLTRR